MTNAEYIRCMSDEKLAEFLMSDNARPCAHCIHDSSFGCDDTVVCTKDIARDILLYWLSEKKK